MSTALVRPDQAPALIRIGDELAAPLEPIVSAPAGTLERVDGAPARFSGCRQRFRRGTDFSRCSRHSAGSRAALFLYLLTGRCSLWIAFLGRWTYCGRILADSHAIDKLALGLV